VRSTYRVLAMLIALGVVLQAAFVAWGMFAVQHSTDDGEVYSKDSGLNAGMATHSAVGTMIIPILALLLLIVSFFARIPGGIKWALITFGVTVLQVALAYVSYAAPVVGTLHAINAFALAAVASIAIRKARVAGTAAPAESAVSV
jgi:hypothetical protein